MVQDGTQEFVVNLPGVGEIIFPSAETGTFFAETVVEVNESFGQAGFDSIVEFFQGGGTIFGFTDFLESEGFGGFDSDGIFEIYDGLGGPIEFIDVPQETPPSDESDPSTDEPQEIDPFDESDPLFDENSSDVELRRQERIRRDRENAEGLEPTTPGESTDALFDEMQALLESQATDESGSGGGDGDGSGNGNPIDEVGTNATNFEELLEELEVGFGESRFSDRGVLGEENIERDMRYPIDIFENSGKLPNLISFEFFHKQSPKLNAANVVGNVKSAIQGIGNAAAEIGQDLGLLSEGSLPFPAGAGGGGDSFTGNMSKEQIRIIKQNQYAQGPYATRQGLVAEMFGGKYGSLYDPIWRCNLLRSDCGRTGSG